MALVETLAAVLLVSAISVVGVLAALSWASRLLRYLVAFAAGTLLGVAFFELLPESTSSSPMAWNYAVVGILAFFLLESLLHWHHHGGLEKPHPMTYLNIVGDAAHNFTDGIAIAVAFGTNFSVGIATTLAVIAHEIPQELGDFAILIKGGLGTGRALVWNFASALVAVLGALVAIVASGLVTEFPAAALPFAAGGFIYISATDLLPELHKDLSGRFRVWSITMLLMGLVVMWAATVLLG